MEQVVEQVGVDIWALISERFAQIKKGLRRLFGCWHLKMSLPFTRGPETYRTCVTCGARRRFDLDQWTIVGGFYYPKNEKFSSPWPAHTKRLLYEHGESIVFESKRTMSALVTKNVETGERSLHSKDLAKHDLSCPCRDREVTCLG